jgi:uncharacterized protein YuzE
MVQAANEMKIKYDRAADVLYCSFGDSRPAISEERGNGVVLRLDPQTEAVVGITIVDFFKRFADKPDETVLVPLAAAVGAY